MRKILLIFALLTATGSAHSQEKELRKYADDQDKAALKVLLELSEAATYMSLGFREGRCTGPEREKFDQALKKIDEMRGQLLTVHQVHEGSKDPTLKFKSNVALSLIGFIDRTTSSGLTEYAGLALKYNCLDEADAFYRKVLLFSGREFESDVRRAQVGIDDVREKRRSR